MQRLQISLRQHHMGVYLLVGLILFSAPPALFAAARAGVEPLCWILLGIEALSHGLVILIK